MLIVGSPWFVGKDTPSNTRFVADFRKQFGQDPDQFAAQAYDALKIIAAAIDRAGSTDGPAVRQALLQTKFDGVMGPFSFTPARDPAATEGVVVLVMQGGVFAIAP